MKFLVDNQLPTALAKWLISHGHEASHVLDAGLSEAKDREIWDYATLSSLVLVTKDEDFSRYATADRPGVPVVWVRLGNCRTKTLLSAFESLLVEILAGLESGARLIEIR